MHVTDILLKIRFEFFFPLSVPSVPKFHSLVHSYCSRKSVLVQHPCKTNHSPHIVTHIRFFLIFIHIEFTRYFPTILKYTYCSLLLLHCLYASVKFSWMLKKGGRIFLNVLRSFSLLVTGISIHLPRLRRAKNQQDATIGCLLLTSISTCFGHHYAHLQENKGQVTAFGVLFWFCWMWLVAVVGRCVVQC